MCYIDMNIVIRNITSAFVNFRTILNLAYFSVTGLCLFSMLKSSEIKRCLSNNRYVISPWSHIYLFYRYRGELLISHFFWDYHSGRTSFIH